MRSLLLALLILAGAPAQAAVVYYDGNHTLDTSTGLLWLDMRNTDNRSYNYIKNRMRAGQIYDGYRFATTVGGALTGRGGSLIIIDDPMKAADANSQTTRKKVNQWFDQTLQTRLDNKKEDAIILIMQRLHVDDLAGHVLSQGGWTHLNLPAIADEAMQVPINDHETYQREIGELLHPEREPQHVLDALKQSMGSADFSAQYQQQPVPPDGNMVKCSNHRLTSQASCSRNAPVFARRRVAISSGDSTTIFSSGVILKIGWPLLMMTPSVSTSTLSMVPENGA